MNLIWSASDSYSGIAATSIVSLLDNNIDVDEINIYIIDMGIDDEHKKWIDEIIDRYHRNLVWLKKIDIETFAGISIDVGRWHISTFSRLFLEHILPSDVKKIIYLDCDMIICRSLKTLWDMDMEGFWCMAVDDCRGSKYRDEIGIDSKLIYTNNGLMVIDLDAWKKNNVESLFIDYIRKYKGNITYMDQGVLNGVLQPLNKVKLLPISYNAQTACYDLGYKGLDACRKPVWAYSEDDFENGIKNPIIVHFTSCFVSETRPWYKKDNHPYRNEFIKYRKMTNWGNEPLWDEQKFTARKVLTFIYKIFPKPLTFLLVRILHSQIYPLMRMIRHRCKN